MTLWNLLFIISLNIAPRKEFNFLTLKRSDLLKMLFQNISFSYELTFQSFYWLFLKKLNSRVMS